MTAQCSPEVPPNALISNRLLRAMWADMSAVAVRCLLVVCCWSPCWGQQAMTGPVWGRHGAVQGVYRQMPGTGRIAVFYGIPYAAPPVGGNRFRHATPPSNWAGVHRADRPGPACPQGPEPLGGEGAQQLQLQSEDCLYLNIFSPGMSGGPTLPQHILARYVGGLTLPQHILARYVGRPDFTSTYSRQVRREA